MNATAPAVSETTSVVFIDTWNGATAAALQGALRMTNEGFAEYIGVATRTVAAWRAQPALVPRREIQTSLDTVLTRATETVRQRFAVLLNPAAAAAPAEPPAPSPKPAAALVAAEVALIQARIDQLQQQLTADVQLLNLRLNQLQGSYV
ncbi:hypothetical protein [Streptomyces noursei]|uniref:hypothetical protein n=1 Tax=Streptomyces noursei TaxID=1971 RepID=UPI0035DB85BD